MTERTDMTDKQEEKQPSAAAVLTTTPPPPPTPEKKPAKKKSAPKKEETAISTKQQAEDLAKIIDAFLIGTKTAEKLKPAQVALCKQTALAFGLNPLKREIHFIPREIRKKDQRGNWNGTGEYEATIVIGYEVYLKRAEATGRLNGWGVTFTKDGTDTKAILKVYKKGWDEPFEHEVYLSEAKQNTPVWDKMPKFMLRKVAIGQGFRLAFPEEMGGLPYMPEELGVGVIQDGVLVEEKAAPALKPAYEKPAPPPAPITVQQCTMILGLLTRKGKEQQPILDYYKVDKLSKLTYKQGEGVMAKLNTYPDAADEGTKDESAELDLDEIDKGIEQQRLEASADKPAETEDHGKTK